MRLSHLTPSTPSFIQVFVSTGNRSGNEKKKKDQKKTFSVPSYFLHIFFHLYYFLIYVTMNKCENCEWWKDMLNCDGGEWGRRVMAIRRWIDKKEVIKLEGLENIKRHKSYLIWTVFLHFFLFFLFFVLFKVFYFQKNKFLDFILMLERVVSGD